jgi:hypothetical protein
MTWDNLDLLSAVALLSVAAVMLIGPLSRRRADDLPCEFRGLVDAADIAESERDELRSRIRLPF